MALDTPRWRTREILALKFKGHPEIWLELDAAATRLKRGDGKSLTSPIMLVNSGMFGKSAKSNQLRARLSRA
jgi:hypothetical protein